MRVMRRLLEIIATAALQGSGVLAALAVLPAAARAELDDGRDDGRADAPQITVAVGETAERDVGIAIGLLCDDLSIVHADLRTAGPASNVLRVTGVQPGDTRCRAGTVPGRPMFVFDIHVTARRTAPP